MEVEPHPSGDAPVTSDPHNDGDELWQAVHTRKRGRRASNASSSSNACTSPQTHEPAVGERRKQMIPPLVVQGVTTWTPLFRKLRDAAPAASLKLKGTARLQTVLPHLQLKRGAGTEDSCACQGLPAWTTTEDIADELRDLVSLPLMSHHSSAATRLVATKQIVFIFALGRLAAGHGSGS
ncbi:hypothetical protein J6590_084015 [Homalodisca vitripennis]|nr:hypothetical protein J6590_084015 [Homalodisca vitripennis]